MLVSCDSWSAALVRSVGCWACVCSSRSTTSHWWHADRTSTPSVPPVCGCRTPAARCVSRSLAVAHPGQLTWRGDEVALITVKTQHTAQLLSDLAAVAPSTLPVVCAQNGVHNELEALRAHLEPGLVQACSALVTGILDVGRFLHGVDDTTAALSATFTEAGFDSRAISDVARWKHRKLLTTSATRSRWSVGRRRDLGRWSTWRSPRARRACEEPASLSPPRRRTWLAGAP